MLVNNCRIETSNQQHEASNTHLLQQIDAFNTMWQNVLHQVLQNSCANGNLVPHAALNTLSLTHWNQVQRRLTACQGDRRLWTVLSEGCQCCSATDSLCRMPGYRSVRRSPSMGSQGCTQACSATVSDRGSHTSIVADSCKPTENIKPDTHIAAL